MPPSLFQQQPELEKALAAQTGPLVETIKRLDTRMTAIEKASPGSHPGA